MPVRPAPKSNPLPLILGGLGLLVVVIVLVVMSQSGGKGGSTPATNNPSAASGKQPHVPAATSVPSGTAKAGKTPTTPPPTLTQDTLQKAASLLDEAKALCNDGVRLRNSGDQPAASAKQSEAKVKIDAIKSMLAAPLRWQEDADLEGWAMPKEYTALGKFYGEVSSLEKRVRMSGGT